MEEISSAPIDPVHLHVEFSSAPIGIEASIKIALFEHILKVLIHLVKTRATSAYSQIRFTKMA